MHRIVFKMLDNNYVVGLYIYILEVHTFSNQLLLVKVYDITRAR